MITLRHHVLTIVAVFLALAAGHRPRRRTAVGRRTRPSRPPARSARPRRPTAARGRDYNEAFVSTLAPPILGGRLADRSVALVTVPGADEQVVTALAEAGGGRGRHGRRLATTLGADLVDPAQKSLVDTLGSQLLTQQAEGAVPAEASTYDRIGQLIGLAVASKEAEGEDVTRKARAIADAVSGAGLMAQPDDVSRRAPLVLLVLGTDADDEGSDAILAGLAEGLAAQADGRRGRRHAARTAAPDSSGGSAPTRPRRASPPSTASTRWPVGWPP